MTNESEQTDVTVVAVAEFSRDMVDTLQLYFETYAVEGVVSVEVSDHGLWLPNPVTGGRQFLGLAHYQGTLDA